VLVQPNSHGVDTRAMMHALEVFGGRARGVTVLDFEMASADHLRSLREAGIRGVRLNLHTAGTPDSTVAEAAFDRAVRLLTGTGLHLQLFASVALLSALAPRISESPVPVVVDHMGMALSGAGEIGEVAKLITDAGCWIKLSAPERMGLPPADARVHRLVDEYAARAPDRIVWGSDWPHSALTHTRPPDQTEPFRSVDDRSRLRTMKEWLGTDLYQRMLCDNAHTLYA
ncbi:MAG: hypothetical protein EOO27_43365, partial [Comamonadaceae bacterium]